MGRRPQVILVFGASGSGKSTVSDWLAECLGGVVIRQDWFYKPIGHLPAKDQEKYNFDEPAAIDFTCLCEVISRFLQGEYACIPTYDFTTHFRGESEYVAPSEVVIVEGTMVMCDESLASMSDCSIFVNAPRTSCLKRRARRDSSERGISPETTVHQFNEVVFPMYLKYVAPHVAEANFTIDNRMDMLSLNREVLKLAKCLSGYLGLPQQSPLGKKLGALIDRF